MIRITKALSLIIIIISSTFGCVQINFEEQVPGSALNNNATELNACLKPLFTFAYPDQNENSGLMPPGMLPTVLPQPQSEVPRFWLPQLTSEQLSSVSKLGLETPPPGIRSDVIEVIGDNIWFSDSTYMFKYNVTDKHLETYKLFETGKVLDVFVSSDKTLWIGVLSLPFPTTSFLKYNELQDRFEPVLDTDSILMSKENRKFNQFIGQFKNKLWIVFDDKLYSIELSTGQARVAIGIDETIKVYSATINPNGTIWFVGHNELNSNTASVYQYDIQNESMYITNFLLEKYGVSPESIKLFGDNTGRVWINNLGWLEPTNKSGQVRSYSLLQFPGFIGQGVEYNYVMSIATNVNYFSDGTVWFSSNAGISKLNPSNGEWCILARNVPGIALAEDGDHFIWFAYGQLYKYDLGR